MSQDIYLLQVTRHEAISPGSTNQQVRDDNVPEGNADIAEPGHLHCNAFGSTDVGSYPTKKKANLAFRVLSKGKET